MKFKNSGASCLQPPKFELKISGKGEGVQNSSSVVKNCMKCVQNYGTIFILKFENAGAGGMDLGFEYFLRRIVFLRNIVSMFFKKYQHLKKKLLQRKFKKVWEF